MSAALVEMDNLALETSEATALAGKRYWGPDRFRYKGPSAPAGAESFFYDLTGRRRILSWGPYDVLPSGCWQAVVRLAFDKRAASYIYAVELGSLKEIARHEFSPGKAGLYEIILDINFTRASRAEVRVILDQGVVGGEMGFYGAEIQPFNGYDVSETSSRPSKRSLG